MSTEAVEKLKIIQAPDEMLYDHFNGKLDAQIKQFGKSKMKRYVKELRRLSQHITSVCVQETQRNKYSFARKTLVYKMSQDYQECLLIGATEPVFVQLMRYRQLEEW